MLKDTVLMKWDNCFTFALKVLGLWEAYQHTDSEDFVNANRKSFMKVEDPSAFKYRDRDVLVWESTNDCDYFETARSLKNNMPLTSRMLYYKHHFAVFDKGLVYDLSFNDHVNLIRVKEPKVLTCDKSKNTMYVLRGLK